MPRITLTERQKDERAAQRYNQRQQDKNPLWVAAGAVDELVKTGVIKERTPDDIAASNAKYRAQLAAADQQAQRSADLYAAYMLEKDAALHAEISAKVERRITQYNMHSALIADIWHTAIRKRFGIEEANRLHQLSKE